MREVDAPHHIGLLQVGAGAPGHLVHRHGEQAEGIVPPQVLLGGERQLRRRPDRVVRPRRGRVRRQPVERPARQQARLGGDGDDELFGGAGLPASESDVPELAPLMKPCSAKKPRIASQLA